MAYFHTLTGLLAASAGTPKAAFVISADTAAPGNGSSAGYYTTTTSPQRLDSNMQVELFGPAGQAVGPMLFYFPAWYCDSTNGYTSSFNTFTLEAAVVSGGTNYHLLFGGVDSTTTPKTMDGTSFTYAVSDALTIPGLTYNGFTTPTTIMVRTGCSVATAGQKQPTTKNRYPTGNTIEQAITNGASSQVTGTGNMTANGGALNGPMYGPSAVISAQASLTQKAFGCYGDSIEAGNVANNPDTVGNMGWLQRALRGNNYNFMSMTRGSNRAQWSTFTSVGGTPSTAATGMYAFSTMTSHSVWALGTNDLNAGRTLADLQTYTLNGWAKLKADGNKIIAVTVLPRTVSGVSNTPITTAFNPAGTDLRGQYNRWLLQQLALGTIDFVYDPCPLVESGGVTNATGIWQSLSLTSDGTHPTAATDLIIQTDFQAWLIANIG